MTYKAVIEDIKNPKMKQYIADISIYDEKGEYVDGYFVTELEDKRTKNKEKEESNIIIHWTKWYDDSSTQCSKGTDEVLKFTSVRNNVTCPECLKKIKEETNV